MSNDAKLAKLLDQLKKSNFKKTIKIRVKKNRTESYSLYFDIIHNGKREYRFPKYHIIPGKNFENEEAVREVITLRDIEEQELKRLANGYTLVNWKKKASFLDYAQAIATKKEDLCWQSALKHLSTYTDGNLTFAQLDDRFLDGFKAYLLSKVKQNTAWMYMSKIKAAINQAIRENILLTNPAKNTRIKQQTTDKQYLAIEERDLLIQTPCSHNNIKDAFIFSCYTGLRISDIRSLTWDNVQGDQISIQMQKTKEPIRIPLHTEAQTILDRQDHSRKICFYHLPTTKTLSTVLKSWTTAAGITKHITFHSARHTFATACLTSDIDLYTVSKLLGHSDITMTQVYAKIVDKVKDDAIKKLR